MTADKVFMSEAMYDALHATGGDVRDYLEMHWIRTERMPTTDIGESLASVVAAEKLRRLGEYLRTAKPKTPTPKPRTWKKRRRK